MELENILSAIFVFSGQQKISYWDMVGQNYCHKKSFKTTTRWNTVNQVTIFLQSTSDHMRELHDIAATLQWKT